MQITFSLNELISSGIPIDKTWFYRNCIPVKNQAMSFGVENLYTPDTVYRSIARKREDIKRNTSMSTKMRKSIVNKLDAIEKGIKGFEEAALRKKCEQASIEGEGGVRFVS